MIFCKLLTLLYEDSRRIVLIFPFFQDSTEDEELLRLRMTALKSAEKRLDSKVDNIQNNDAFSSQGEVQDLRTISLYFTWCRRCLHYLRQYEWYE